MDTGQVSHGGGLATGAVVRGSRNPVTIRVSASQCCGVQYLERWHSLQVIGNSTHASNLSIVNNSLSATASPVFHVRYSVKIMNPKKKSEFEVLSMKTNAIYSSVDDLKEQLLKEFRDKVSDPVQSIGYIEPGHGLRGKQRWLYSESDLTTMYDIHNRKEIILWCFGKSPERGTKRPLAESRSNGAAPKKASNYSKHADRIAEVEEIEDELKDKYSNNFSDVQYRAWANLIVMKKHESLDKPPDLPFWRGTSINKKEPSAVSPGKRICLRGQCVDQLLKWHELLEKGAITQSQYNEFHSSIMDDVRKF